MCHLIVVDDGVARYARKKTHNASCDRAGKSDTRWKHFHDRSLFMVEVQSTIAIIPRRQADRQSGLDDGQSAVFCFDDLI